MVEVKEDALALSNLLVVLDIDYDRSKKAD